jgi:hypothetical protein
MKDDLKVILGIPLILLMLLAFLVIYSVIAIIIFLTLLGFLDVTFDFINRFCKVDFVCYAGDPNWLGYILLAFPFIYLGLIWIKLWLKKQNSSRVKDV